MEMEKHFPPRKPSPNPHHETSALTIRCPQYKNMLYDSHHICKTYDKNIYSREYFKDTRCPACPAVGKFKMHGSYSRYVIYFDGKKIVREYKDIRRIMCLSCKTKTTHAVMPCDIIPYKMLSLFVFMYILVLILLGKIPVLKIADEWGFSFQFIYSVVLAFRMHGNNIRQYFRETSPGDVPAIFDDCAVLRLIKKPYTEFQLGYIKTNRRPCFMCKFFNSGSAPPVGIHAPRGAAT